MIKFDSHAKNNKELVNRFNSFFKNYKPHFLSYISDDTAVQEIHEYGQDLSSVNEQLCIVGLGGSSLGAKAFSQALGKDKKIIFFDNVDAYSVAKKFEKVDIENCHWLFISKSGGTQEVLSLIDLIIQKYDEAVIKNNCTIITDNKKSKLYDWGQESQVKIFFIPDDIGGRFSVFTPVGLLPLSFLGENIFDIKKSINDSLSSFELCSELASQLVLSFKREEWIHLYWIYSDTMQGFGLWLQQLWMESLGKKVGLQGQPAPRVSSLFCARGVSDQHSILQQISQGEKDKLVIFLSDERALNYGDKMGSSIFFDSNPLSGFSLGKLCEVEMNSTYNALQSEGVSVSKLLLNKTNASSVAQLMTTYMMVTVAIANYLSVNPFDQPGVESSKLLTKQVLGRLSSGR